MPRVAAGLWAALPPELGERDGKVQSIPSNDQMDGPVVHLVAAPEERERSEKRLNRRDETAIGPHGTIVPCRFTPFP